MRIHGLLCITWLPKGKIRVKPFLHASGQVSLTIYDQAGNEVCLQLDGWEEVEQLGPMCLEAARKAREDLASKVVGEPIPESEPAL
jgi:hypothetical protein